MLQPSRRGAFLRSVAGRIGDGLSGKVTDQDLQEAVAFVLSCYGISMPHPARAH